MTATIQKTQTYPETRIVTWIDDETGEKVGEAEYVRADVTQAMVAAAYEDAAIIASGLTGAPRVDRPHEIAKRTPTDARTALDAMLAKAREDVLREAAQWCRSHTMDVPMGTKQRKYAGMYATGEHTGGIHSGMGYADAIEALIPTADRKP